MANYAIQYTRPADRRLKQLSASVQRRIVDRVDALASDPRPPGCVKLVGADDLWRIRVGASRLVYTIRADELLVLVVRVAHRKDVYRGL